MRVAEAKGTEAELRKELPVEREEKVMGRELEGALEVRSGAAELLSELEIGTVGFAETAELAKDPELEERSGELDITEIEPLAELEEEGVVGAVDPLAPMKEEHEPFIPAKY